MGWDYKTSRPPPMTSLRKSPPHKGSTAFNHSASSWEQVFRHTSLWGQYTFKPQRMSLPSLLWWVWRAGSHCLPGRLTLVNIPMHFYWLVTYPLWRNVHWNTLPSLEWLVLELYSFCTQQIPDFQHSYNVCGFILEGIVYKTKAFI